MRFAGLLTLAVVLAGTGVAHSQDTCKDRRGRKCKELPTTARIDVTVVKDFNGKPIQNAAVIFRPVDQDGKLQAGYEVKTGPDGKTFVDVIPVNSSVVVQVLADGFSTYAKQYEITDAKNELEVRVIRPQEQVSAYQDNSGKESSRKAGMQTPVPSGKNPSTTKK